MSSHEESHAADAESLLARTEMGGHETTESKDEQEKVVDEIDPPRRQPGQRNLSFGGSSRKLKSRQRKGKVRLN
jgi:hypothetical protein